MVYFGKYFQNFDLPNVKYVFLRICELQLHAALRWCAELECRLAVLVGDEEIGACDNSRGFAVVVFLVVHNTSARFETVQLEDSGRGSPFLTLQNP